MSLYDLTIISQMYNNSLFSIYLYTMQIWAVIFGKEYIHSENDSAYADKDKALQRAAELAAEKGLSKLDDTDWGDGNYWTDWLYFIAVAPLDYHE